MTVPMQTYRSKTIQKRSSFCRASLLVLTSVISLCKISKEMVRWNTETEVLISIQTICIYQCGCRFCQGDWRYKKLFTGHAVFFFFVFCFRFLSFPKDINQNTWCIRLFKFWIETPITKRYSVDETKIEFVGVRYEPNCCPLRHNCRRINCNIHFKPTRNIIQYSFLKREWSYMIDKTLSMVFMPWRSI